MNINIFKKIYLFFIYRRNLLKIETDLKVQFNIRIDRIFRFYTVLNIPEEIFEEPYNIRKADIDLLSGNYLREFNNKLTIFLSDRGMTELYKLYDLEKVDKFSYLLVFGFSLLNTKRLANNLIFIVTPILIFSIIISILLITLL